MRRRKSLRRWKSRRAGQRALRYLLSCVSTGQTREEVEKNMQEAIEFHLEGLRLEGLRVPQPHSYSTYVEIPA